MCECVPTYGMAHSVAYLHHPELKLSEQVPVGFSWTCLFLGFMLFAYKGDWWLSGISFLVTCVVGPVPNILFCWKYNEWYLHRKLQAGYQVVRMDNL